MSAESTPYEDILQATKMLKTADPNPPNTFTLSPELSAPISIVVSLLETFSGNLDFELAGKRYKLRLKTFKSRNIKPIGKMGRPGVDSEKINRALNMFSASTLPVSEICKATGICRGTLYRYVKERNIRKRQDWGKNNERQNVHKTSRNINRF